MRKLTPLLILFSVGIPASLPFLLPPTKPKTNKFSQISSTLVAFSKRSHHHKEPHDAIIAPSSNRDASNAALPQRKKQRNRILSSIAYSLLFLVSKPRTSNAVIGYIPKGASGLREQVEPSTPHTPKKIPKEILEKDYGDNNRMKELELKVYEQEAKKAAEKEEESGGMGGLRPGRAEGDDTAELDSEAKKKQELIEQHLKDVPASSSTTEHKISAVSTKKPVPKSKKQSKAVSVVQFATFISVGVVWARAQSASEAKRVQKGIEIYESQKAEFFNITTTGEEGDLDEAIKKLNVTLDDEEDDDDDDDEDDDVVQKPKKQPKKPDSGPSSPGSSGGSPPPKSDMDKPSDEDVERLKRMFDKK